MAKANPEHKCSEMVFHPGSSWRGTHKRCTRSGVVEREGKWWCRQHDPEAKKARREKAASQWVEARAVENALEARRNAESLACRGVLFTQLTPGILAELLGIKGGEKGGERV